MIGGAAANQGIPSRSSKGVPLDDRLAEGPHKPTQLIARLLTNGLPGRECGRVGSVFDVLAKGSAGIGEGPLGVDQTASRKQLDRSMPCLVAPPAGGLQRGARDLTRCGVEDQRIEATEASVDQGSYVPVTAELTREGDGVPEGEVRCIRPRQARLPSEQRSAFGRARLGGGSSERRGASHFGAVDGLTESSTQRRVCGGEPGARDRCRGRRGMARRTISGLKLKKVAITTSAGTAPMAAARDAK